MIDEVLFVIPAAYGIHPLAEIIPADCRRSPYILCSNTSVTAYSELSRKSLADFVVSCPFLPPDATQSAILPWQVVCLSVRPSVTLKYRSHISWNSWKIILRLIPSFQLGILTLASCLSVACLSVRAINRSTLAPVISKYAARKKSWAPHVYAPRS